MRGRHGLAMNQPDAYRLLAAEMAAYRTLSFGDLAELIGPTQMRRIRADDSAGYAIEVKVSWRHNEPGGEILVEGWIADDTCGPMHRLDENFVVSAPFA